jgi:ArsR family transcriptional regulator, virulence genes transcriptional regulator
MITLETDRLVQQSTAAAELLRALANEQRLLILCHLAANGELSVSALIERVQLSQSALSQHLARLRNHGIVAFRREAQTLIYYIADDKAARILGVLHEIYCPEL